ncbi:MAG: DUF6711 family protein [Gemmiger sp.]|jgi:hypothetical protein|uniref:DUF6711 family protein n=1 Tax=Gemmiger formicilis TaxID=745368 RepID=UPI001C013E1C|nr:DUF6711 family protein [Gemmiger formicilis]MBT9674610.1 hypothetical protein [Gemmiger formicilis]DAG53543.1 MAG TPA: hypothetical protein [Caudoviricetes sp.]
MTFTINGTDLAPYIKAGSLKVTQHKISTDDSGRDTQDGTMYNTVIAKKYDIEAECRALKTDEASVVLTALMENDWVTVAFTSPVTGGEESVTMYCTEPSATHAMRKNGVDYWTGIDIKLVER